MPSGFANALFTGKTANTYGLGSNCYYCSVAALLGKTVEDLFKQIEVMQQDTANEGEIVALFGVAGVAAEYRHHAAAQVAACFNELMTLPAGQSVGLGYRRANGSRHMIVVTRDVGYINNFVNSGLKCVDYQASPPRVTGFPPEPNLTNYWIFYRQ